MGFGDPFHKHPLRWYYKYRLYGDITNKCFHCELPMKFKGYHCSRCDFWVHESCIKPPPIVTHPLHDQHPLILLCDPKDISNTNLCNKCQIPCTGRGYIYSCRACNFSLHLKCFLSHHHEKHDHPLSFSIEGHEFWSKFGFLDCRICGYRVYDANFICTDCGYCIHHDCTLIPSTVKHHHVHELTIRHDFPEECDQVYCDVCEDRDDKELDRTLSYYYCKECDYIAHVPCVTQQKEDSLLIERATHEHPLRIIRDRVIRGDFNNFKLGCNSCNIVFDKEMLMFPSLIKHPLHPEHALTYVCVARLFKCTDCDFTLQSNDAIKFSHPLCQKEVVFRTDNVLFRCDACGDLGKGFRMCSSVSTGNYYDFHLECFALPGNFGHENHPHHPLCLFPHNASRKQNCNVCKANIDPEQWVYCCPKCDIFFHINCVATGLLSALRLSIKNEPRFCAIIETNKASFNFQSYEKSEKSYLRKITNIIPPKNPPPVSRCHFSTTGWVIFVKETDELEPRDKKISCYAGLGIKEAGNVLYCPKCNMPICTPAKYSSIQDWESTYFEGCENISHDVMLSESEPLKLLCDEQTEDLYCSICSVLIFPPTYSCSSCQIYFHKSCAELPRKVSISKLTFSLVEPPFYDSLSCCRICKYKITGYAYLSSDGAHISDVQCIFGAPLIKQVLYDRLVVCHRQLEDGRTCIACHTRINKGTIVFRSSPTPLQDCIHIECALLPPIIQHRIHQHALELAPDLFELDDEYICDACEKELNPNLWAYRCVDTCKGYATSHVTCVITSKKKCHFDYDLECQGMTGDEKTRFRSTKQGVRKYSADVL